ncbi:Hypothetical protein CINCED_3A006017 [Cinara cedri]|uniref:Uncharacterized protein n=2 Tax=Cinara cedri TaxID=506608 RepID=A0A5E4NMJ4_9HEMI|nr:Hypothetical protein CINCED_3A006017 [Cinara cedri]
MLTFNTLYTHNNKKKIVVTLITIACALAITRHYVPCVVNYIDTRPIITAIAILLIGVLCLAIASNNVVNMSDNVRPHIKERFCGNFSKIAIGHFKDAFSYAKFIEEIDGIISQVEDIELQECFDEFFTYTEVTSATFNTHKLLELARLFRSVYENEKVGGKKADRKYIMKFVCTPDDCAKYLRSLLPDMSKETSSAPNMNNSNPDVIPNIDPVTYYIVPRDCIGGLPKVASMN